VDHREEKLTGFPNPEKGYCPTCKAQELFVPLWLKYANDGSEELSWKCTKCGFSVKLSNT
jgi:hypothetical protein